MSRAPLRFLDDDDDAPTDRELGWQPVTALPGAAQTEYARFEQELAADILSLLKSLARYLKRRLKDVALDQQQTLGPLIAILQPGEEGEEEGRVAPTLPVTLMELTAEEGHTSFPRARIGPVSGVRVLSRIVDGAAVWQRSPAHIIADVLGTFLLLAVPPLCESLGLEPRGIKWYAVEGDLFNLVPDDDDAEVMAEVRGRAEIPALLLEPLSPMARFVARLALDAYAGWLMSETEARSTLRWCQHNFAQKPSLEHAFPRLFCESLQRYSWLSSASDPDRLPLPAPLPTSRPIDPRLLTQWLYLQLGESSTDLNLIWWPDHLDPEQRADMDSGFDRIHSAVTDMVNALFVDAGGV